MPRISDELLNSVIYIYKTGQDAEVGTQSGGTGFLVSVPSKTDDKKSFGYIVTNKHVIDKAGGTPTVRFTDLKGNVSIVSSMQSDWACHLDGDDVAIIAIKGEYLEQIRHCCIPVSLFLSREIININDVGPGDDVFTIGRFIQHDGKQKNTPVVMFGNISMMPNEKVRISTADSQMHDQDAFLVETHSLSGFSGSPVFLNRILNNENAEQRTPWLLGLDCSHMSMHLKIKKKCTDGKYDNVVENYYSENNSGHMVVVPAWKILEILFAGKIADDRRDAGG